MNLTPLGWLCSGVDTVNDERKLLETYDPILHDCLLPVSFRLAFLQKLDLTGFPSTSAG